MPGLFERFQRFFSPAPALKTRAKTISDFSTQAKLVRDEYVTKLAQLKNCTQQEAEDEVRAKALNTAWQKGF